MIKYLLASKLQNPDRQGMPEASRHIYILKYFFSQKLPKERLVSTQVTF